ncbi:MAG: insulinase family protein [Bacteroidetes bacterium]|nr:insulinase family protein [Bacteroidota bacterium]
MRFNPTRIILFLFFIPFAAPAQQTTNETVENQPIDHAVYHGILPNGLTYYVRKNESPKKRAVMYLVEKAGSLQENDDQLGLAHFVEHMAFHGTRNFPRNELVSYLQKSGITFGADVNAQTAYDQTCYQLILPTDSMQVFEKGLDILTDWAGFLSFDAEQTNSERNVILEEARVKLKTANGRMNMQTMAMEYNNSRYAYRLPIGTEDIIKNCSPEALTKFYRDWYRPDLQAVIVVGDVNAREVVKMIKEKFSVLKNPDNERQLMEYSIPEIEGTRVKIITDKETPYTYLAITTRLPGTKTRTDVEYFQKMRGALLNYMLNARIADIAKHGNPPFLNAGAYNTTSLGNTDIFTIRISAKPGELQQSIKTIVGELVRAKRFGFTEDELKMAKTWFLNARYSSFVDMENHPSVSYAEEYRRNFLTDEGIPGLEYEYNFTRDQIGKIQLTDINLLTQLYTPEKNRTIILEAPEKSASTLPDEKTLLDWINNPGSDEKAYAGVKIDDYTDILPTDLKSGKIESSSTDASGAETLTLSNGAHVILKNTDFSTGQILFDIYGFGGTSLAGDADYPSDSFAGALIGKSGVSNFDKVTLDKMLINKVVAEPYISNYVEGIRGISAQRHFETALKLIHLYFTAPRCDSTVWAGLVSQQTALVTTKSNSPANVFADSVRSVMYNHNIRGGDVTEATLKTLKMTKAYEFYKQRFADAGNFTFVFVGNLEDINIRSLIKKYIASLPATRSSETYKDLHMDPPSGKIVKIIRRGIDDKSTVELIFHGPLEYNPDNNLQLKALAGILQIKLIDRLREQENGVYVPVVAARYYNYPDPQYNIYIHFNCSPANVEKLIAATMDEISKLKQNGALPVDILKYVADETRTTQTAMKKNQFWIEYLSSASRNKEDAGYIKYYIDNLKNVTAGSTKATANKYLDANNLIQLEQLPEGK